MPFNFDVDLLIGPIFEEMGLFGFCKIRGSSVKYDPYIGCWYNAKHGILSSYTFEEVFNEVMQDPNVSEETKENILFHLNELLAL